MTNSKRENEYYENSDDLRSQGERVKIQSGETYFKAICMFMRESKEEEKRIEMKYNEKGLGRYFGI